MWDLGRVRSSFLGAALLMALALPAPAGASAVEGRPLAGGFDPADLLEKLSQAVGDDDTRAYGECLADSFAFTPYAGAVADNPDVDWDRWDRKQEMTFATRWLREQGGGRLDLDRVRDRATMGLDRAEWTIAYELEALGEVFSGQAAFVMVRHGQRWFLREWIDLAPAGGRNTGPQPTSGEVRAVLLR